MAEAGPPPFPVYDNMFFPGRPSTAPAGLVASNIIYGGDIWPQHRAYGTLPGRAFYAALVARRCAGPGPIVIDIEHLPFAGGRTKAAERLRVLATLADWTHAAAPGRIVGYFGYNVLTDVRREYREFARALVRHVDAFFPALYADSDDRAAWARRAAVVVHQYRDYARDKPIYFYLWPQYNAHTPRQFEWIDGAFWRYQLETSRRLAAGVVIWGTRYSSWQASSGWWQATVAFVRRLRRPAPVSDGPATD